MLYDRIKEYDCTDFEETFMGRKEIRDYPFNKEIFREALIKAMGDMSQLEFCGASGLSYANMNRFVNGKNDIGPTISTIKKIYLASNTVSYEELLEAAGYDPKKYRNDKPVKKPKTDYFSTVMHGMAKASFDWKLESSGFKEDELFEVLIERQEINKWFFIPVTKRDVTKDDIQEVLLNQPKFTPGSKISFVTDNDDIFDSIKNIEFPLLSLCLSVIKIDGLNIIEEANIKTSISSDITVRNREEVKMFQIGEG